MDRRLFFLLNQAQHRVFRYVDRRAEDHFGTSVTRLGVLMYLGKHPGAQQKTLSQALGLNNPAVTGLVSRMELSGLVQREPCPEDGRVTRLQLTEEGRQKLEELPPFIHELNQKMMDGFSDEEMEVVFRFLNALLERF
ncbi:MAG: MarR family transcriptional regulator [Marinobacter sp.]|uniref:MarR family winged helix-turn-helix transcriptional regulator n=1 Tax=Marinobacter sp. TaxID=50741 RepID=UPI00299D900E|nr:MarR family transcriptional regulator [Marinobacter sp.]MDX1756220.1 MarR family transcriptional regulator [Marinobacter sp.]